MPRRWKFAIFAGVPFVIAVAPLVAFVPFASAPRGTLEFDLRDNAAIIQPAPDADPVAFHLNSDCPFGRSDLAEG